MMKSAPVDMIQNKNNEDQFGLQSNCYIITLQVKGDKLSKIQTIHTK